MEKLQSLVDITNQIKEMVAQATSKNLNEEAQKEIETQSVELRAQLCKLIDNSFFMHFAQAVQSDVVQMDTSSLEAENILMSGSSETFDIYVLSNIAFSLPKDELIEAATTLNNANNIIPGRLIPVQLVGPLTTKKAAVHDAADADTIITPEVMSSKILLKLHPELYRDVEEGETGDEGLPALLRGLNSSDEEDEDETARLKAEEKRAQEEAEKKRIMEENTALEAKRIADEEAAAKAKDEQEASEKEAAHAEGMRKKEEEDTQSPPDAQSRQVRKTKKL